MNSWGRDREVEKPKTKTEQVAAYQVNALALAARLAIVITGIDNAGTDVAVVSRGTLRDIEDALRIAGQARRLTL